MTVHFLWLDTPEPFCCFEVHSKKSAEIPLFDIIELFVYTVNMPKILDENINTRERILDCARQRALEVGFARLSLRAVGRCAGVSAMAIYRHFEDKEALRAAVIDEGFRLFFSYLMKALEEEDPWHRFAATGERYLDFALEHPRDFILMFLQNYQTSDGPIASLSSWRDEATFQLLQDRLHECMDAGLLRKDDPEQAALTVWSQCHGLTSLYLGGKLPMDEAEFRKIYSATMGRLMAGLREYTS